MVFDSVNPGKTIKVKSEKTPRPISNGFITFSLKTFFKILFIFSFFSKFLSMVEFKI
jgi:hypothetical protein